MSNKIKCLALWLFACICLAGLSWALDNATGAEDNWLTESQLNIIEPGVIETVLMPGLHCLETSAQSTAGYPLDLSLLGPDNKPRAFELFWTEKGNMQKVSLESSSLKLDDQRRLLWEGEIPDNFNTKRIIVSISDKNYVGKADIEGLASSGWRMLAEDIALYKTAREDQAVVDIPEGGYKRLRLYFSGYDTKFQEIPAFVEQVEIEGELLKTGYAEDTFKAETEVIYDDLTSEIRAALPGSGIWIDEVTITTASVFQGTWRLGWETITMGEQAFEEIRRGERSLINNDTTSMVINLGVRSKGSILIIKLESREYFGDVPDVSIKARLPRMIFFADQRGTYTARTGLGKKAPINETASGREKGTYQAAEFSRIKTNPVWQPYDLAKEYKIKGGPFKEDGFTWKTNLNIDKPGFYRLILSDRAGLENNRQGLRLVKDDAQVPYFFGRKEKREINIKPDFEYDKDNNRSTMALTLPYTSSHWKEIRLIGEGIFKRRMMIETQKPGNMAWQAWMTRDWTSNEKGRSVLTLELAGIPDDQTGMRLVVDHGDNQPVEPKEIKAVYQSQDLFFLASDAGEYQIAGGNPKTTAASYDLSLIQDYLLNTRPMMIKMGEIEPYQGNKVGVRLSRIFSEQGWGLYAVMGLVTLALLIIIAFLFPREGHKE